MPNNTRGRGRNRARETRSIVNQLKSSLHGHDNKLRFTNPPCYSKRPFNTLTVSHVLPDAGTEYNIGTADVVNYIKNQLGLAEQTKSLIVFKLRRIDLFGVPTGGDQRPAINMDVSSLVPTVGDPATPGNAQVAYGNLFRKQDIGNLSDCAKLSYTFPMHMSDIPMSGVIPINILSASSNVAFAELRFHLSWSTIDVQVPVD